MLTCLIVCLFSHCLSAHFSKYSSSLLIEWNLNWIVVICTNIFHVLSTLGNTSGRKACSSVRWMTATCVFQNTVNLLSQRQLVYSFPQEHEYFSVRHVLQITNYSVAAPQHCVISSTSSSDVACFSTDASAVIRKALECNISQAWEIIRLDH